jgi:HEAT repeat protein
MDKKSAPEVSGVAEERPKRRRGRSFLAPAALATLLAGGGTSLVGDRDDESSSEEVREGRAHWQEWQLRRIADHPNPDVGARLAASLPAILAAMSEIDRVGLIAGWAVSPSPRIRLAIARALRHGPPAVGSLTAIEHLARDPSPLVRVAIAEAAWLRRREDPTRLIGVLHRLADDDERFVRDVAHLALGDV